MKSRERFDIEGATDLISGNHKDSNNRGEHQKTAKKAIKQELYGCCLSSSCAISTNEEVDRNQHRDKEAEE